MKEDQKVMSDKTGSTRLHPIKTVSFSMKQPIRA